MPGFVYEEGEAIVTGQAGQHDFVFSEGEHVTDTGISELVFEEGTGIGGSIITVYVDGDASANGGFGTITDDLATRGYVFEEYSSSSVTLTEALNDSDGTVLWYVSADEADALTSGELSALSDWWSNTGTAAGVFGEDGPDDGSQSNRDENAIAVANELVGTGVFIDGGQVEGAATQGECKTNYPSHPVFDTVTSLSRFVSELPITEGDVDVWADYELGDGRRVWLDGSYIRMANSYYGGCDEPTYYENVINWLNGVL
ncbi:hypothetical protein M197_gp64 [Haloarcula hispanica tailed virus 2]|uniref:Uncharacterized protein n=1 Tax=Haloarcula hispanica tailed virus 2 TaxID=1273751 RepID=R4T6B2_9CAUD|nr:hypothetical protein M197_gp64 [Haloarcula hispanica tailed virus 2]AGM11229.1 hypothetical protein HHTV2_64 [Haloarcula hispanica tailed virus 2]